MSEPEVQKPSKKTRKRAKHTPGPWHVVEGKLCKSALEVHANSRAICELWRRGREKTELANAYLIAAAPDMLKALKSCLSMMRSGDYDCKDVVYHEVERAVNLAIGGYK